MSHGDPSQVAQDLILGKPAGFCRTDAGVRGRAATGKEQLSAVSATRFQAPQQLIGDQGSKAVPEEYKREIEAVIDAVLEFCDDFVQIADASFAETIFPARQLNRQDFNLSR